MTISTRTPEGEPNKCPVCGQRVCVEPSRPPGDAPCPTCGTLLWFPREPLQQVVTAWEYGTGMIRHGEVTAGLEVLQNVVAHKPSDAELRRLLRGIERRVRGTRRSVGTFASDDIDEAWWEIRQARHKRAPECIEWDTIDRAVERGLAIDPWDADLHVELGRACSARGYKDAAQFAYQCAIEISPERTDVQEALRSLGSP